jgi:hypothetical protein
MRNARRRCSILDDDSLRDKSGDRHPPSSLSVHPVPCQLQSMCLGFLRRLEHLTVDPLQLDNRSGSSGPANRATRLTPLRVNRNRGTRDHIAFVLEHDFSRNYGGPISIREFYLDIYSLLIGCFVILRPFSFGQKVNEIFPFFR